jgi:glycosyltransferase involved in cell wall biosynthesis
MNNYYFTYIIGYRHSTDRIKNLRRVLDWINGFSNVEIILVEQDKHSKISYLNLKAKHIFTKSEKPYNRSWAFNVGLRYSSSPLIVFGDSDLVMNPEDTINGLKELKNFDMVSPYNSVIDLTPEESNLTLNDILKIDRHGRGDNDNQKINICGGITMFNKESILKIGGWNQDFVSWGGEDDFQAIKVKKFLSWTELKSKCYHLWHKKASVDKDYYTKNLQILNAFGNATKEQLEKHIQKSLPRIGKLNEDI